MLIYWAERAWLPGGPAEAVAIAVDEGRIVAVEPDAEPGRAERLAGLTLPGFANVHSHAFHRALRGRTHEGRDTFWGWREAMYAVADRLDPDSYHRLARAVFAEMALSGVTCVGEFHYVHHPATGGRFDDPNAMGEALITAADDAGVRITLLDALDLGGGLGEPLRGAQRRFSDGSLDGWFDRVDRRRDRPRARIGVAAHSVRAVPATALEAFACMTEGRPIHIHLSEQRAENEACRLEHGCSPTELLDRSGLLGRDLTAVHATHLDGGDIALLGGSGTGVCLCPTTERDLADGIGPAAALARAGSPLSLGTDSHAVIDLFEEVRGMEMHERLVGERRGRFSPAELLDAATAHRALGWTDAGAIAPDMRADLVTVDMDSPRTAGVEPAGILFAATAADVRDVVADGRRIVAEGRHVDIDVPRELAAAIEAVMP
jgi:formiminoglutamate deiminase